MKKDTLRFILSISYQTLQYFLIIFQALTYCDLKCVHMGGLVEVLRLYPEYQQQFANDIQHDLTFNLREGFECQDSDIGPTFPLPSISEDDENVHDGEGNDPEVDIAASTVSSISPHHSVATPSPFLARSTLIASNSPRLLKMHKRGRSLITLRERVERQHSVNVTSSVDTTSLEDDVRDDECDHNGYINWKRHSLERLDSRVSTLHKDMTQLSFEVRNALQTLQEITFSTMASDNSLKYHPAHSIPNINATICAGKKCASISSEESGLQRSSSHPPDIWGRDIQTEPTTINISSTDMPTNKRCPTTSLSYSTPKLNRLSSQACQTELESIDLKAVERFIMTNPHTVLNMLGVDINLKTGKQHSPLTTKINFANHYTSSDSVKLDNYKLNINNDSYCRSTEALLQPEESPAPMYYKKETNPDHLSEHYQGCINSTSFSGKSSNSSLNSLKSISASTATAPHQQATTFKRLPWKKESPASAEYTRLSEVMAETTIKNPWYTENFGDTTECPVFSFPHQCTKQSTMNPIVYRFSAGDADNLEKGIRTLPSTRSLRDTTPK